MGGTPYSCVSSMPKWGGGGALSSVSTFGHKRAPMCAHLVMKECPCKAKWTAYPHSPCWKYWANNNVQWSHQPLKLKSWWHTTFGLNTTCGCTVNFIVCPSTQTHLVITFTRYSTKLFYLRFCKVLGAVSQNFTSAFH